MRSLIELHRAATKAPWRPMLGSGDSVCTGISHEHEDGSVEWVADCLPDWMLEHGRLTPKDHRPNLELIMELRNRYAAGELVEYTTDRWPCPCGKCPGCTDPESCEPYRAWYEHGRGTDDE